MTAASSSSGADGPKPGQFTAMISSTALDLPEHRAAVREACIGAGVFPIGMEQLPARDASGITVSLEMVDKADIYLGIYAWRYGWVPDGKNISITEMEFARAAERKLCEILIFTAHKDHPCTVEDVEADKDAQKKLATFKAKAITGRVRKEFLSPEQLGHRVSNALHEFLLRTRVVTPPKDSATVRYMLVVSGSVSVADCSRVRAIFDHLKALSQDFSLTLEKIEDGSIKLWLLGSYAGYDRLCVLHNSNALSKALGAEVSISSGYEVLEDRSTKLRSTIPHNLPSLQPFFGREDELRKIADALDPESPAWGALIDGPGGMGKTSLAVRAAYDAPPEDFKRIIFVSLKTRELDDDGIRDLSGFILSGLVELLNELARELDKPDIAKAPEEQRPRLLLDALRGTQTLLILDNLESLVRKERDTVFTFVKKLPQGCKAILTSRGRIGSGAEELILEKLSQEAALATLADIATHNPDLRKTSEAERIALAKQIDGNPLLLCWTAGQLGRGHCLTLTDALNFLRSCPKENDPLKFLFGDLVETFTGTETKALTALTCFNLPATVEQIAAVAGITEPDTAPALSSLVNRSLAVPIGEPKSFAIVPLVAEFLRNDQPEVVRDAESRLEQHALAFIFQYGAHYHDRFPTLDAAWSSVDSALPGILRGDNDNLQKVCDALRQFLNFMGHWDAWYVLSVEAERRALASNDFREAGWRAFQAGQVHRLRRNSDAVLEAACTAESHWNKLNPPPERELGCVDAMRGRGHYLKRDYPASIAHFNSALSIFRNYERHRESSAVYFNIASALNGRADAERHLGETDKAIKDYQDAQKLANEIGSPETEAASISSLAQMALDRHDWQSAVRFAVEAMPIAKRIHCQDLIAKNSRRLAEAILRQGKASGALSLALDAVKIYESLGSRDLAAARDTLAECKAALAKTGE